MYIKTIISFIFVTCFISCNISKTTNQDKVYDVYDVYDEGRLVGSLGHIDIENCIDCYFFDSVTINNKKLTFLIPVILLDVNGSIYASPTLSIKKRNSYQNIIDIELHSIKLNRYELHIHVDGEEYWISETIHFMHDSYMKEIGEDDFESIKALKICYNNDNYKIKDTIDTRTHPIFNNMKNCNFFDF